MKVDFASLYQNACPVYPIDCRRLVMPGRGRQLKYLVMFKYIVFPLTFEKSITYIAILIN